MFRRPASFLIAALVLSASGGFCPYATLAQTKKSNSDTDISKIGHRSVGRGANLDSVEHETALGKQLEQEVRRFSKFVESPIVLEYLNRLGQNLAQNSDARFPITVRVIDSDVIDGFTLPGGYIYLNKGLILHTETEAELAGVLAYGIASTALRGATRSATKGEMMQLAMIPVMLLGPDGWAGPDIYEASGLAIPIVYLKLQRDFAFDADYFGLQYLYKSGYDPESMPRFFERVWPLTQAGTTPVPKTFSPFPPLPDRLKAMRTEIQKILPRRDIATLSTSDFEAVKERLRAWNPPNLKKTDTSKPTLRKPSQPHQNQSSHSSPE
jgi:predicted Zn-dependent protease